MRKIHLIVCVIVVALTGCASLKDKDTDLNYLDYAGQPITSFWMPRLDGWTAVDDKLLVVRTELNKEYLLKLSGFCPNLRFAKSIGVTSSAGTVDRFEKVIVEKDTCMISEIRPIDSARMKADRKALKAKRATEKTP
jgi:hypothetical protein